MADLEPILRRRQGPHAISNSKCRIDFTGVVLRLDRRPKTATYGRTAERTIPLAHSNHARSPEMTIWGPGLKPGWILAHDQDNWRNAAYYDGANNPFVERGSELRLRGGGHALG